MSIVRVEIRWVLIWFFCIVVGVSFPLPDATTTGLTATDTTGVATGRNCWLFRSTWVHSHLIESSSRSRLFVLDVFCVLCLFVVCCSVVSWVCVMSLDCPFGFYFLSLLYHCLTIYSVDIAWKSTCLFWQSQIAEKVATIVQDLIEKISTKFGQILFSSSQEDENVLTNRWRTPNDDKNSHWPLVKWAKYSPAKMRICIPRFVSKHELFWCRLLS